MYCVNTYSSSYKNVYDNSFLKPFQNALVDPILLEKEGKMFLLDAEIDRKNIEELNDYLKKKYKLEKIAQGNFPIYTAESQVDLYD